jgi:hypothetical protein
VPDYDISRCRLQKTIVSGEVEKETRFLMMSGLNEGMT